MSDTSLDKDSSQIMEQNYVVQSPIENQDSVRLEPISPTKSPPRTRRTLDFSLSSHVQVNGSSASQNQNLGPSYKFSPLKPKMQSSDSQRVVHMSHSDDDDEPDIKCRKDKNPLPEQHAIPNGDGHLPIFQKKWGFICSALKGNSQSAAEVLMRQAAATAQLEELVLQLLGEIQSQCEERAQLEQQHAAERGKMLTHAAEAHQRAVAAEQRIAVLMAVQETGQVQQQQLQQKLKLQATEKDSLLAQTQDLQAKLAKEVESRAKIQTYALDQDQRVGALQAHLEEQRLAYKELHDSKSGLQGQLRSMLRAEKELTDSLRATHQTIEEQLHALREQVQAEKQKRSAAVKKKAEALTQVALLTARLQEQQDELASLRVSAASMRERPTLRERPQTQAHGAAAATADTASVAGKGPRARDASPQETSRISSLGEGRPKDAPRKDVQHGTLTSSLSKETGREREAKDQASTAAAGHESKQSRPGTTANTPTSRRPAIHGGVAAAGASSKSVAAGGGARSKTPVRPAAATNGSSSFGGSSFPSGGRVNGTKASSGTGVHTSSTAGHSAPSSPSRPSRRPLSAPPQKPAEVPLSAPKRAFSPPVDRPSAPSRRTTANSNLGLASTSNSIASTSTSMSRDASLSFGDSARLLDDSSLLLFSSSVRSSSVVEGCSPMPSPRGSPMKRAPVSPMIRIKNVKVVQSSVESFASAGTTSAASSQALGGEGGAQEGPSHLTGGASREAASSARRMAASGSAEGSLRGSAETGGSAHGGAAHGGGAHVTTWMP